ncbi:PTS transporter subunit EIIC, partial [Thomasclavelia sp.]|uniref:PTS transporter subunit EIIC n=1 Tax=Thomasclavelia sp. TaxID=3025757 RepID=UPI0025E843DC
TLMFISLVFWAIGLHGDNMIGGVFNPILTTLGVQNLEAVQAGLEPTNIVNNTFHRAFFATGGTGCMLGLTIAMLLICKRPENQSIAKLALVPELFNIGEVSMFGVPIVLNPTLVIPFIIAPLVTVIFGYVLTMLHICPVMYVDLPWTMPPLIISFLGSGGNIMGPVCQLLGIILSALVYLPFVKIYEKQQAQLTSE